MKRSPFLFFLSLSAFNAAYAADHAPLKAGVAPPHTEEGIQVTAARRTKKATTIAPGQAPLDAVQPETDIGPYYLKHVTSPHADYLSVMQFTPSASNSSPNGAGFSSKNATIRGFQDGQYNVTFDGIPWADPGSFGHQTTSFFSAPVLQGVNIDRGPGTASTIGNATFGGTMALLSEALSDNRGGSVNAGFGSGSTYQAGLDLQSGIIQKTGGTRIAFNYDFTKTNGLLQYAGLTQRNYFLKLDQPLRNLGTIIVSSERTTLGWDNYTQPTPSAAARYGLNFANLNNDPESQLYRGYNHDHRSSDFSYLGVNLHHWGFRFEDKAYIYGFGDLGSAGAVTLGTTPNTNLLASGVPAKLSTSFYRVWGNIARLERDFGHGFFSSTVRGGVWYEGSRATQDQYTIDATTGQRVAFKKTPSSQAYTQQGHVASIQSYLEFAWHPLDGLTITPGWKHVDYQRALVRTTGTASGVSGLSNKKSYPIDLAATSVNYRLKPNWSVYGQWAMGFQAPPVNTQATTGAAYNSLTPQQTINYQIGTVWKKDSLVFDLDGYYINFRNAIIGLSRPYGPGGGQVTVYQNSGGVIYKGVEAEITYVLGHGLSLTANGSINSAPQKGTGLQIANAPASTADFGALYDRGPLYGSIMTKFVGRRFAGNGQLANGANYTRLPSYTYTDLTLGYQITPYARAQFQVNNIANNRTITEGSGSQTTPTYYYLAQRNYYGTISLSF